MVPASAWRLFRDTSTVHLLVISGLHIGMFGALGLAVGNLMGRVLPLTRRFRARGVSSVVAIAAVLAYATLAGWSLPVTRASIMAGVGIFAAVSRRRINALNGFTLALATVLAVDPRAPLDTGVLALVRGGWGTHRLLRASYVQANRAHRRVPSSCARHLVDHGPGRHLRWIRSLASGSSAAESNRRRYWPTSC